MRRELFDAVYDSVVAAIRLSTVGIIVGSGDKKGQGVGTGTLICWKDHHLILTAKHVIAGTLPKNLRFIPPPDSPPIEIEREKLRNLPAVPTVLIREPVELELGQLVADDKLDLAAIQVNSNLAEKYPARFFNIAVGGRTPAVGRTITTIGFPYDTSRPITETRRVVSTSVEQTRVEPNREGHPGFDPVIHFLSTYNEAVEYPEAEPLGMSGCAMWSLSDDVAPIDATEGLWYPKLDLAGVGISWHRKTNLLMMVRREIVEEFLTTVADIMRDE